MRGGGIFRVCTNLLESTVRSPYCCRRVVFEKVVSKRTFLEKQITTSLELRSNT